ncbi:hypothetical protein KIW84_024691 [Lathyrus oleraceus]|uniref:Uncharacterized protein n=1 Tax=Pisum sativum TaxID=3888 RepID=A0A9D5BD07_PEA|nr:hypothetical protein KIW84_024691 [Pisum sativum]
MVRLQGSVSRSAERRRAAYQRVSRGLGGTMRSATAPNPSCSSGNRFNDDACDFECVVGEEKLVPLYGKGRSSSVSHYFRRLKSGVSSSLSVVSKCRAEADYRIKKFHAEAEQRIKECRAEADQRIRECRAEYRADAEQRIKKLRADAEQRINEFRVETEHASRSVVQRLSSASRSVV